MAWRAQHWPQRADGTPRLAGVSSFGIGGANVHMVLQEPPTLPAPQADGGTEEAEAIAPCHRGAHVLSLSAKTAGSLSRMAAELADYLDANSPPRAFAGSVAWPSLGRVAHTLGAALGSDWAPRIPKASFWRLQVSQKCSKFRPMPGSRWSL